MDNALARHVALAGYRSQQGLRDLLELLQNHCDQAEFETFRNGVELVDQKLQVLIDMIFGDHPGLAQDIAEKTQKFGRPL